MSIIIIDPNPKITDIFLRKGQPNEVINKGIRLRRGKSLRIDSFEKWTHTFMITNVEQRLSDRCINEIF